jgi:hypothetical protein
MEQFASAQIWLAYLPLLSFPLLLAFWFCWLLAVAAFLLLLAALLLPEYYLLIPTSDGILTNQNVTYRY